MILRSANWLVLVTLVAFGQSTQPSAPEPVSAPLRELPWGQLNFLHTTDTHGWHAGHLQEYIEYQSLQRSSLTVLQAVLHRGLG